MADRVITALTTESEVVAAMVLAHNAVVGNYSVPDGDELTRYVEQFDKAYRAIAKARTDVASGRVEAID